MVQVRHSQLCVTPNFIHVTYCGLCLYLGNLTDREEVAEDKHRRIYHWAIWAMPPPPLDSEKFFAYGKNATLEKFDSQENS